MPPRVRERAPRADGHRLADRLSLRRNQPDDASLRTHQDEGQRDGEGHPNHFVVRLTDDALFNCPLTVASDVGSLGFRPEEIGRLRTYLLKGGFLWVDDFWGTLAWQQWSTEIAKVLPASKHPIVDVPIDDPMLRSMFEMTSVPQITNIQFWRGVGGLSTSERGSDSLDVHLRAIRDQKGRVMVLMTHNTDIADSWEREGEDDGRHSSTSSRRMGTRSTSTCCCRHCGYGSATQS